MEAKNFGYLLMAMCVVSLLIGTVITYTLWVKHQAKGLLAGYLISAALFMAVFLAMHKIQISLDSQVIDYLAEVPWILVSISLTTVICIVASVMKAKKDGHSMVIAGFIPAVTAGILLGSLAVSNKIMNK